MSNQAGINVGLEFQEDQIIRRDVQDVSQFITDNKEERNSGDNDNRSREVRKFASVPVIVLQQLKDQLGIDYNLFGTCPEHTGRFLRWLNDNPYFRTSEASLGNVNRFVR